MLKQKKLLILISVLTAFFLLLALIVRQSGLSLYESLQTSASAQGMQISGDKPSFSLPLVFQQNKLTISLPTKPLRLPIELQNSTAHLSLANLLLARAVINSESDFYGGKIQAQITGKSFSSPDNLTVKGADIVLDKYPLLQIFGLSGLVYFDLALNQVLVRKVRQNDFQLEAEIKNGAYQGNYKIQGFFPIPTIQNFNLRLSASAKGRFSTLKLLDLRSNLGEIKAKGIVNFSEDYRKLNGSISGKLSLSAEGQKEIGEYLKMAAKSSSDTYDFNIKFDNKAIVDFTINPE